MRTPLEILEGFGKLFRSVYSKCDGSCEYRFHIFGTNCDVFKDDCSTCDNSCNYSKFHNVLHKFNVSPEMVVTAARKIKPNMTIGPDNKPSFIVKDCINCLAILLRYLFNLIIQTATFPSLRETSKMCPVFKTGVKTDVANYRPIACNFAKLFESILSDKNFQVDVAYTYF